MTKFIMTIYWESSVVWHSPLTPNGRALYEFPVPAGDFEYVYITDWRLLMNTYTRVD